ncbi:MFS transporter [Ochrobactrum teleogrylli]|uniref:MFS transporter n=1 Tax=Ochrobactrum teleogrylli TaxID=2479765 RepID=UPI0038509A0E
MTLPAIPRPSAFLPGAKLPPLIAVSAVMLGTFTSILNSRLTDIGLADLRGAFGLGFDEASWLTTAYITAEVAAIAATVWLRTHLSPAIGVMVGAALFSVFSFLAPFSPSLPVLLALQALRGLAAGMLIPMTFAVVMRNISQQRRLYVLSIYALISGFTPNLAIFAEAWIIDHLSWEYLFWANVIPGSLAVFGAYFAKQWDTAKLHRFRRPDLFGLLTLSLGLASLVAALDQGNRLDWYNSGLITGLSGAAAVLLLTFVVNTIRHPVPMLDLRIVLQRNAGLALSVLFTTRFATMATAFIIPQFLIRIQGYRSLEIGNYFLLSGLPQLVLAPLVAWLCYRFAPRNLIVFGAILFSVGVSLAAVPTHVWNGDQFMSSMLIQSIASPFLAVPVMLIITEDITFPQIPWIAMWVHIVRTVGTTIATAAITTFVRVDEQVHSNLLGTQVQQGDHVVQTWLDTLASSMGSTLDGNGPTAAIGQLAKLVQREAYVLAYADALSALALITLLAAIAGMLMRPTKVPGTFF